MNALRDGIQRLNDEAGGLLTLQVIQRADLPALMLDGLMGDAEAVEALRLVNNVVGGIQAAPRRKPMLCGACPRGLHGKAYSIIIARPACDDPSAGLALAICNRCGPDFAGIQVAARVALARIWPNLRPVAVTHPQGGRA